MIFLSLYSQIFHKNQLLKKVKSANHRTQMDKLKSFMKWEYLLDILSTSIFSRISSLASKKGLNQKRIKALYFFFNYLKKKKIMRDFFWFDLFLEGLKGHFEINWTLSESNCNCKIYLIENVFWTFCLVGGFNYGWVLIFHAVVVFDYQNPEYVESTVKSR